MLMKRQRLVYVFYIFIRRPFSFLNCRETDTYKKERRNIDKQTNNNKEEKENELLCHLNDGHIRR
jgi:hypothetical protein